MEPQYRQSLLTQPTQSLILLPQLQRKIDSRCTASCDARVPRAHERWKDNLHQPSCWISAASMPAPRQASDGGRPAPPSCPRGATNRAGRQWAPAWVSARCDHVCFHTILLSCLHLPLIATLEVQGAVSYAWNSRFTDTETNTSIGRNHRRGLVDAQASFSVQERYGALGEAVRKRHPGQQGQVELLG